MMENFEYKQPTTSVVRICMENWNWKELVREKCEYFGSKQSQELLLLRLWTVMKKFDALINK